MADLNKRNFYLEDYKGNTLQLLGGDNYLPFLYDPSGLGFGFDLTTISDTNLDRVVSVEVKRPDIKGQLVFRTYGDYVQATSFITSGQASNNPDEYLKLYYIPLTGNDEVFYYKVYFTSVEKGEKDETTGLLLCNFTARRLSNYLSPNTVSKTNDLDPDKVGTGTFPLPTDGEVPFIRFGIPGDLSGVLKFDINVPSNIKVPTKLTLIGAYDNPTWVNKTSGEEGGYFLNSNDDIGVAKKGTLIIKATHSQYITNNGVNAYQHQARDKLNFLYLVPGINNIEIDVGQLTEYIEATIEYDTEKWTG